METNLVKKIIKIDLEQEKRFLETEKQSLIKREEKIEKYNKMLREDYVENYITLDEVTDEIEQWCKDQFDEFFVHKIDSRFSFEPGYHILMFKTKENLALFKLAWQ